jgi:acyl-CoA synthetase (AMP-forming)/AMP-acid ligase II
VQPTGGEREIQVRGYNVMPGYFDRPEENRVAFTPDGWFRTGDWGFLDSDGYLTVSGRIKELIVRDGEKMMPREIEDVLENHPRVLEAAVVGEPDGAGARRSSPSWCLRRRHLRPRKCESSAAIAWRNSRCLGGS